MPHNQNPRGWAENDVANQSLDSENDKAALQTLLTNLQERLEAVETKMEEVEPRISGVENATGNLREQVNVVHALQQLMFRGGQGGRGPTINIAP